MLVRSRRTSESVGVEICLGMELLLLLRYVYGSEVWVSMFVDQTRELRCGCGGVRVSVQMRDGT